jgi:Protein of unknown function (DUF2637)
MSEDGNLRKLISVSWIVVIVVALALSNWSLAVVGHAYGLPVKPVPLAYLLSVVFDGAALIAGSLTLRSARELGSNGSASRIVVVLLAGTSAWLNSEHASILHLGVPAHVMYAASPAIAITLFELQTRFDYKDALRRAGRTVDPLPTVGATAWILHPWGTLTNVWQTVKMRTDTKYKTVRAPLQIQAILTDHEIAENTAAANLTGASKMRAIEIARNYLGEAASSVAVQDWLSHHGVEVSRQYIRYLSPGTPEGYLPDSDIPDEADCRHLDVFAGHMGANDARMTRASGAHEARMPVDSGAPHGISNGSNSIVPGYLR